MVDGAQTVPEKTIHASTPSQHAGAFFPSSQHFMVTGGVFSSSVTNHVQQITSTALSDFQVIPLGDVQLLKELRLENETGIAGRRRGRGSVRRMYSAKIEGKKSDVTVALYQGDNAEETWRGDISKHSCLRHPNIVQIYATASSCGIHAAIFHDDMIPLEHFLELYQHSPVLTVYIWGHCATEWSEAQTYLGAVFHGRPRHWDCTFWVSCSRGRLYTELIRGDSTCKPVSTAAGFLSPQGLKFLPHDPDSLTISSLTENQYHHICYRQLRQSRRFSIPFLVTVRLASVISWSSSLQLGTLVEVAFTPKAHGLLDDSPKDARGNITSKGWTCVHSCNVGNGIFSLFRSTCSSTWLSQAIHILSQLKVTSDHEDYVVVSDITFKIKISTTAHIPAGYLFLCPPSALKVGPHSYRWPSCPAYWSLDPSGGQILSAQEANNLGFPWIELTVELEGRSWDASVYAGLRQFHQAKGFDPESQDVARHLGYPLYRLTDDLEPPLQHPMARCVKRRRMRRLHNRSGVTEGYDADDEKCPSDEDLATSAHGRSDVVELVSDRDSCETAQEKAAKGMGEIPESCIIGNVADQEVIPSSAAWNMVALVQLGLIFGLSLYDLCESYLRYC